MIGFLKSLFPGARSGQTELPEKTVEHNGYCITPCPKQTGNGWSTEATIKKEIKGEVKTHHFIRADSNTTKESAVQLVISKARTTIDQLGERIFN